LLGEIHQILLNDFSMQMSPKNRQLWRKKPRFRRWTVFAKNLGFVVGLDTVTTLLAAKISGEGVVPVEYFLISTKLDTFCYLTVQTASCYVPSF